MARPASIFTALTPNETETFLPGELQTELQAIGETYHAFDSSPCDRDAFLAELEAFNPEVLIAAWKTPLLPDPLPSNLRYVCYLCGSVKKLVTRRHLEDGLLLTNWGGSISRIVAAMHLDGAWKDGDTTTASLFGRKVGIHGFGQVARELTLLLHPFGTEVMVYAPDVDATAETRFGVKPARSLDELFASNDVIVELAPLIPETTGIVDERLLRLIRPGGVFVNVGRGAVVDEAALGRVAQEGHIQVGLDVFTNEPLPLDSPFRGLRNVSLTPHLAGPTTDRRRDAGALALRNIHAYANGGELKARVTTEAFDRSS